MIQTVKGTKDLLPDTIRQWQFVENIFRTISDKFGYEEIRTPIFEKTEVFSRSIGEATDIVNKEMYTFTDKGGESITLRPEMTAALVRSVMQHSLLQQASTLRLWAYGPFFRYERPQKGRQRQFHQFDAECLGSPYPESDVEIILLASDILKTAGIKDARLLINTLGNEKVRSDYRTALIEYLKNKKDELSGDSQVRLDTNPLRVLDSKDERDGIIVENAPSILDYLDTESGTHFETVISSLKQLGIEPVISKRLVRGLDYYSHTVFEFQSSALGAQDSLGGGGRYDGLFGQLGGKDTPAVGFALGVERLLIAIENTSEIQNNNIDAFLIATGDNSREVVQEIAIKLRNTGKIILTDLQRRSVKAQFREANKVGASFVIVIGEEELQNHKVVIKKMSDSTETECDLDNIENFFLNQ
jgi:histidyl-tRNA synthetase